MVRYCCWHSLICGGIALLFSFTLIAADFVNLRAFNFPNVTVSSTLLSDTQTACISGLSGNQFYWGTSQTGATSVYFISTKNLPVKLYWNDRELLPNQQYLLTANSQKGKDWCGELRAELQPITLFSAFSYSVSLKYTIDTVPRGKSVVSNTVTINATEKPDALLTLPSSDYNVGNYDPQKPLTYNINGICFFTNVNKGLLNLNVGVSSTNQVADDGSFLLLNLNQDALKYRLNLTDAAGTLSQIRFNTPVKVQGSSAYQCNGSNFVSLTVNIPDGQKVITGNYSGKLLLTVSTL